MSDSFRTKVGPRGRVTIPAAAQREAGLREGDDVVIAVTGPGAVTVMTPQAIKDSIRAGIPVRGEGESPWDAVADVRALRDGKVNEIRGEDQGAPEQ